jgi:hypothetical protein
VEKEQLNPKDMLIHHDFMMKPADHKHSLGLTVQIQFEAPITLLGLTL